jgi:hypothetical protein
VKARKAIESGSAATKRCTRPRNIAPIHPTFTQFNIPLLLERERTTEEVRQKGNEQKCELKTRKEKPSQNGRGGRALVLSARAWGVWDDLVHMITWQAAWGGWMPGRGGCDMATVDLQKIVNNAWKHE